MRISRNPFMVGLACILTLNICLAPALYAQGSPSRSDEDDYLALQASIFDTLFGTPWTGEDWAYPLAERVEGTGEYAGVNRYGQEFTFTIVTAEPLDLEEAGLSPEQLQTAIEEQISMSSIVALLTTSQAEIGIQGVATSGYLDGEGELLSFIIICELADPDGPLFQDYGDDSLVVIQPQIMPLGTVTTQDTTGSFGVTRSYRVGNINSAGSVNGQGTSATVKPTPVSLAMSATVSDDCAAACHDAYNNTMDDIAQTLQAALTAAQNARDAAITAAQNALDAALTAAQNDLDAALTAAQNALDAALTAAENARTAAITAATNANRIANAAAAATAAAQIKTAGLTYAAAMALCLVSMLIPFFGTAAGAACAIAATATLAIALALIADNLAAAIATNNAIMAAAIAAAETKYQQDVAAANAAYAAAVAAANTAYDNAVAAANTAYDAAVAAANTAYDNAVAAANEAADQARQAARDALNACLDACDDEQVAVVETAGAATKTCSMELLTTQR